MRVVLQMRVHFCFLLMRGRRTVKRTPMWCLNASLLPEKGLLHKLHQEAHDGNTAISRTPDDVLRPTVLEGEWGLLRFNRVGFRHSSTSINLKMHSHARNSSPPTPPTCVCVYIYIYIYIKVRLVSWSCWIYGICH